MPKFYHPKDSDPDYDKSLDDKRAYNYCIHLIAKQDYSKFKLSRKLRSKGYQQSVVDICIEKLIELKYLQEDEYTRMRVIGLAKKGYGVRYIIQKCREEALELSESEVYEILEIAELDEDEILAYQVEKKLRNYDLDSLPNDQRFKLQTKITRSLMTRGFDLDAIKRHLS